ncbi:MAG: polyhydroxyalkanoate synthesis regulator DNA-binding domain-containing protein [Planctomycetota bacterium]
MRTIKRYSNRKLYDTVDKRYITLEQIAELVREGQDIRVVENQTGQDLTNVTLSQILLEQEKAQKSGIPRTFFMDLIQRSSTSVVDFMRKNVLTHFDSSLLNADKIEENVDELVRQGELEQEEARQLKDEIKDRSQTLRERLDELIERRVQDVLARLSIPTKGEVDALRAQLEQLNHQLDLLGAAPAPKGE